MSFKQKLRKLIRLVHDPKDYSGGGTNADTRRARAAGESEAARLTNTAGVDGVGM